MDNNIWLIWVSKSIYVCAYIYMYVCMYVYLYQVILINIDKRSKWSLHTLMRIICVCVWW